MSGPSAIVAFGPPALSGATVAALSDRGWTVCQVRLGEPEAERRSIEGFAAEQGGLSLAVLGMDAPALGALETQQPEAWWSIVEANLGRAFRRARAAAPRLHRDGSLVFVTSEWGQKGLPGGSAFAAAAAGLVGLTRALARELAPVRVNAVVVGALESEAQAHGAPGALGPGRPELEALATLRRLTRPGDVAAAVGFLASEDAAFITGQVLPVTGGRTRG